MPEPYCLAMVLCDGIHRDATTGKYTILGTFSTLGAIQFPAQVSFCVYFSVTDGLGPTELYLRIVDASCDIADGSGQDEGVVCRTPPWAVEFVDPLMVLEVASAIRLILPRPGLYHCELWAGNDLLMSRRLLAIQGKAERPIDEGGSNA